MNVIDGKFDRRNDAYQRILWLTDNAPLFHPRNDRRICAATRRVLIDLLRLADQRQLNGLVVGTLRRDGRVDLIAAGDAFSYPAEAGGVAGRLLSVTNHLFDHPLDAPCADDCSPCP